MKPDWWFLVSVVICCASAAFMGWLFYRLLR